MASLGSPGEGGGGRLLLPESSLGEVHEEQEHDPEGEERNDPEEEVEVEGGEGGADMPHSPLLHSIITLQQEVWVRDGLLKLLPIHDSQQISKHNTHQLSIHRNFRCTHL